MGTGQPFYNTWESMQVFCMRPNNKVYINVIHTYFVSDSVLDIPYPHSPDKGWSNIQLEHMDGHAQWWK